MLFGQDSLEGILDLLVPDEVLQQTGSLSQLRALRRQEVAESLPARLPQVLEKTVRSVTQTGTVAPIPMHNDRKANSKALAPSVVNARLDEWLESVEGKQWRADREKVWS